MAAWGVFADALETRAGRQKTPSRGHSSAINVTYRRGRLFHYTLFLGTNSRRSLVLLIKFCKREFLQSFLAFNVVKLSTFCPPPPLPQIVSEPTACQPASTLQPSISTLLKPGLTFWPVSQLVRNINNGKLAVQYGFCVEGKRLLI